MVNARLGPFVLVDLLRDLIDRYVISHGLPELLRRMETKAATESRRLSPSKRSADP